MTVLGRRTTDLYLTHVERYLSEETFLHPELSEDLLMLLGCPYIREDEETFYRPNEVDADARDYMPEVLVAALSVPTVAHQLSSLIAGISRIGAWSRCVESPEGAYALALALLCHIERCSDHPFECYIAPDVRLLLNQWLKPHPPWVQTPDVHELCEHLFGEAWCIFALPLSDDGHSYYVLGRDRMLRSIVAQQRPPLLSGLCVSQEQSTALPLPRDMGFAP
jgi:hypothetical protein